MRLPTHRLLGSLACAMGVGIAMAVGALGALAAPVATIGGAGLGALVGLLASLQPHSTTAMARATANMSRRDLGIFVGGAIAATWVVVTGAVFLLGPASMIVLATLLLTGLPAIWLWRRNGAVEAPVPAGAPPVAVQPTRFTLDQMSTSELCVAWRRSYWALLKEADGVARFAMVQMRQRMLDELERRDADGFGRWLETGARAGSDPGRYLAPDA